MTLPCSPRHSLPSNCCWPWVRRRGQVRLMVVREEGKGLRPLPGSTAVEETVWEEGGGRCSGPSGGLSCGAGIAWGITPWASILTLQMNQWQSAQENTAKMGGGRGVGVGLGVGRWGLGWGVGVDVSVVWLQRKQLQGKNLPSLEALVPPFVV